MAARSMVNGLENEWGGRVQFLHLEFRNPMGREMGRRFGVDHIPAFLILDGDGQQHWRGQGPMVKRSEISSQLAKLLSSTTAQA